jgi:hypothetical protein
MTAARLRIGEITAGAGALVLSVLLFLDWAKPETSVLRDPGADLPLGPDRLAQSGFSTLGWVLVVMLVVLILCAVALAILTVTERDTPVLAVVAAVATTFWALAVFLVLLVRLTLAQPDLGLSLPDDRVNILAPAWLGLLCVALIGAGGWLTLRDDRLQSPASEPPEVPVRPAPPATV